MIIELWTRKREMADEDENNQKNTRNQGYGIPDLFEKTSYWWYYMQYRESYLLYQGW